jgi:Holliday junction resolvasome RuvABC endonuclease subunit
MNILSLDIATHCGWKTKTASGVWDFTLKRGESYGMKLIRFKSKVRETIDLEGIEIVSYERVAGLHKAAIISASEMVGVLHALCIEKGVEITAYSAGEIKKFATGKGNANKAQMVQAAKEKYGYIGDSDDESDAIHLYYLTDADLNSNK